MAPAFADVGLRFCLCASDAFLHQISPLTTCELRETFEEFRSGNRPTNEGRWRSIRGRRKNNFHARSCLTSTNTLRPSNASSLAMREAPLNRASQNPWNTSHHLGSATEDLAELEHIQTFEATQDGLMQRDLEWDWNNFWLPRGLLGCQLQTHHYPGLRFLIHWKVLGAPRNQHLTFRHTPMNNCINTEWIAGKLSTPNLHRRSTSPSSETCRSLVHASSAAVEGMVARGSAVDPGGCWTPFRVRTLVLGVW